MAGERTSFLDTLEPNKGLEKKVQAVAARIDDIEAKPEPKPASRAVGGVTWILPPISVWTVSVTGSSDAGSFSPYETIDFSRDIGGANTVYIELLMANTRTPPGVVLPILAIDWRLSVRDGPIHVSEITTNSDENDTDASKYSTHMLPVHAGKAEVRYRRPNDDFDYEIRVYGYQ